MTCVFRLVACGLLLGGANLALGQQAHWSQHMRAHADRPHQNLEDIREAYESQHGK